LRSQSRRVNLYPLYDRFIMLSWFRAKESVEAASALADSLPTQMAGAPFREFLQRAVQDLRGRKLNFYKKVRFANAFKWRLRENGIEAETAHEITQTLLINVFAPSKLARDAPAGRHSLAAPARPLSRKSAAAAFREAEDSVARGNFAAAITQYQDSIALRPRHAEARNQLGVALLKLGRNSEAEDQFRQAIVRQPNYLEAHVNLGVVLTAKQRFQEAEDTLRRALKLKPADTTARSHLGQVLFYRGRLDLARIEFEKVSKVAPRDPGALFGLGVLARSEGRFDEAEDLFRRALAADPQMAVAWSALAGVRKLTQADAGWCEDAGRTAANMQAAPDEASVRFAIGKYFDDVGQYDQAFDSYRRANELLKAVAPPYCNIVHARHVDDMIRIYTPAAIARARTGGSMATRPIFVVGMPRSGTSLTEQILASHPAVAGAGELPFWNDAVRRHEECAHQSLLDEPLRKQLADEYLNTLQQHCPDANFVVDKMPRNADYLGVIYSAFPNARIIYMRRDPLDTCLSCYFQHFSTTLNYTFDLSDLRSYYSEHARLISHWRKVLPPGTMLDVPYEKLVADPEQWTRKMLAFLGLEWDERCLKFNETRRPVVTSSYWQVRQRIYGDSVQRWRNYSKFLGPLRKLKAA
jgi:Flp pilus assembly protein TadD